MLNFFLDLLFPKKSLTGTEGMWLTQEERTRFICTPVQFSHRELQEKSIDSLLRIIAAAKYHESPLLQKAIWQWKYKRTPALTKIFASMMNKALEKYPIETSPILCPIPLHWSRRFSRGFNQAELLAEELTHSTGWPCMKLIKRSRATGHQAWRNREQRLHALDRAFSYCGPENPPGHVLLVDDLLTTGSTLNTAAKTLKNAGISHVEAIVIAAS